MSRGRHNFNLLTVSFLAQQLSEAKLKGKHYIFLLWPQITFSEGQGLPFVATVYWKGKWNDEGRVSLLTLCLDLQQRRLAGLNTEFQGPVLSALTIPWRSASSVTSRKQGRLGLDGWLWHSRLWLSLSIQIGNLYTDIYYLTPHFFCEGFCKSLGRFI